MSKIRITAITDKWGFRHACYVAKCYGHIKKRKIVAIEWFLAWLCSFMMSGKLQQHIIIASNLQKTMSGLLALWNIGSNNTHNNVVI